MNIRLYLDKNKQIIKNVFLHTNNSLLGSYAFNYKFFKK